MVIVVRSVIGIRARFGANAENGGIRVRRKELEEPMASAATTKKNKEIVSRFAEEFVNKQDVDSLAEFVSEDFVDYTPFGQTTGRDALLATTKELKAAFPDFAVVLEEIVGEGDTVAVRMTQRGTHKGEFMGFEPTGKSFEIEAMGFLRVKDGKITERRVRPDVLGIMQQLGFAEQPTA